MKKYRLKVMPGLKRGQMMELRAKDQIRQAASEVLMVR